MKTDKAEIPRDLYRPHKRVYYNPQLVDHKTGEFYTPERRVKQSFVPECDINTIMKQYSQTGQVRHISANAAKGAYMDLPDEVDYQTSLAIVAEANAAFATLPAKIRDRFQNDARSFLEFIGDPNNRQEAENLGLLKEPAAIPVAPAPAEPQKAGAGQSPASATKPAEQAQGPS